MRVNLSFRTVIVLAMLVGIAGHVRAAAPIGWRTDGTGCYPDATPPVVWGPEKNVAWSTPMASWSNSTPVITGDRIFVCSEPDTLVCVDRRDGRVLWQRSNARLDVMLGDQAAAAQAKLDDAAPRMKALQEKEHRMRRIRRMIRRDGETDELVGKRSQLRAEIETLRKDLGEVEGLRPPQTHNSNGYSSATPVTDGRFVYVQFGTGVVACYDVEGERQWIRHVQDSEHGWGQSSSPVLSGGTLVVLIRALYGIDPATGETNWETVSPQAWGSPGSATIGSTPVVITPSGQVVRSSDGGVLWTEVGELGYCTPVVTDGVLYMIQNTSRATRLPSAIDDGEGPQMLWQATVKGDRHYASPVIHDGLAYTISRRELMTVLDATTGGIVYEQQLNLEGDKPNSAYPSVALAGDYVYVGSQSGKTIVVRAGRDFEIVAENRLEAYRSSPVFQGRRMYVRGFKKLWCIEGRRVTSQQ
ncbi:MAG: hypothetical protein CMJ18_14585 [Phycisphaeraceae bacterium]|nr:hypothetical protein [Phycisphaeraceae bacterium]